MNQMNQTNIQPTSRGHRANPTISTTAASMTKRWNKALHLIADGRVQETDQPGVFSVAGDSGSTWTADLNTNDCDCPDHTQRGCFCGHMLAGVILLAHQMSVLAICPQDAPISPLAA